MKRNMLFAVCVCAVIFSAIGHAGAAGPQSAESLHERAKNLYDVGDYRAALDLYERVLEKDPGDGLAWDVSAWCLRYMGDRESAEERYKKALVLISDGDAVWPMIGLGELYMDVRKYDDALTRLKEALALALDSGNEEASERARRNIGMAEKALLEVSPSKPHEAPQITDSVMRMVREFDKISEGETGPDAASNAAPVHGVETGPPKQAAAKPAEAEKPKSAKPKETEAAAKKSKKGQNAPAPEIPKRPPRRDVVYGMTLGSPIGDALAALKKQGCDTSGEPFGKDGKIYHPARNFDDSLPPSLTGGVSHRRYYAVEHEGLLLSFNIELDYDRSVSYDELKNASRASLPALARDYAVRGVRSADNIFTQEINVALSNTYGMWIIASDKGNGTCRLEINHIDLYGLSGYWSSREK
jgi:tetratricopeptide (TPR) repeat protein